MKKWMGVIAWVVWLTACSEDPAQGAAELCKREVESRSKKDQGLAELAELIAGAKPQNGGGFQIDAYVYYRKGSPDQQRASFTCVVGTGGQMQNLLIQPFPERF
ncbi:MAG: hypothetical protein MUE46_12860 [Xanthomonadales bacterium]|jgi:hypothetical protein|nr:hypothetical protein [Xanthomonadales bacterium]